MTDEIRFCTFTADGRHPAGVVVARWEVPGIGDLCNFHASEGWPELFTAPRTFTDPSDVDADLIRQAGPRLKGPRR